MRPTPLRFVAILFAVLLPEAAWAQCVSLTTTGSATTQSFDTLSNTAGSTTNNLTLTGWFMTETGGGARDNEQYAVDTGASNTGDTFSYGAAASTDRALGSLQSGTLIAKMGACFTNVTGTTITYLDIAYSGEQWRIGNTVAARDDRLDFEYSLTATDLVTGTWTATDALDFTNPIKTAGTASALDGNSAANRVAISGSIPSLAIANGATFWIRWNDLNASGTDDGLAIDDFSLTPQTGSSGASLSINDVSQAEGNSGTTVLNFTVSLSAPAGPGGVTFDIASADGTATAGSDYVASSLTGQVIPAGSVTYAYSVQVNGDATVEANETFLVNVINVVGATVSDGQGQGTIQNDDVALTPIHDIQGPGASSPIVGATVTTSGIVTGLRSNGFFIQTPDAEVDADPATSEGILVFTSSAPPAAAAVGNLVQVSATVAEFVPTQDPLQPPLTELISPTTVLLSAGNPLPAAVSLSASFPSPSGGHDQLERLEGMRVNLASFTVSAPTTGNVNEANATATSNGVFQGVVTGNARAFREAGIQEPDPAPSGSIPPIPRFDSNPEVIRVDSDSLIGTIAINVRAGQIVTGLTGPLDYSSRRYTVLPEGSIAVSGNTDPTAVTAPATGEVTIASYNLQRFYDTTDDPVISDPVLTSVAYQRRLSKASAGIRQYLGTPDIVGVVEVEHLAALIDLANQISTDALAAGEPDPLYQAYLVAGNDVGGIDVGFLVKSTPVAPGIARVSVNAVVQENAAALFSNPDASNELLHDRPPLRLDAVINNGTGQSWPVTVIVNHLRSLNDIAGVATGSNGWATTGERVRAKRLAQAVDIANLVQSRQSAQPTENIVLIGDFNGFEFNDGLVDVLGTLRGAGVPDNQTAVPGDGVALANPALTLMTLLEPAAQRYSYLFDGNAQALDHALISASVIGSTLARRVERARLNADFPDVERGSANALRLSDHDPLVLYLTPSSLHATDVAITLSDSPDPATAGLGLNYSVTAANVSSAAASTVSWSIPLPLGMTFQSLLAPAGWSCTTPAVGASGPVSCNISILAAGANDAFSLQVGVGSGNAAGSLLTSTATISTISTESDASNNSATANTLIETLADLSVVLSDSIDPIDAGTSFGYQIEVNQAGPSDVANASLTATLPIGTTFVSLSAASAWICSTPAVGAHGDVVCTANTLFVGDAHVFALGVDVDASLPAGSLSATATLTSLTPDSNSANNSDTETTTVGVAADLSVTLNDTDDPVNAGTGYAYALNVVNAGPSVASNVSLSLPLPAGTAFAALSAPGGWTCTSPAVGSNGIVTCTLASFGAGDSASFTVNVAVDGGVAGGTVLSATATVSAVTPDPASGNNTDTETTGVDSATDIALSLGATPNPVVAGTPLSVVATVSNTGPIPASGVLVSVTLPAGTNFDSGAVAGGGSCVLNGAAADCAFSGTVDVGAANARAATVVLAVSAAAPGASMLNLNATATTANTDPNLVNNAASTPFDIIAEANLAASLSLAPTTVTQGGTATVTAILQNLGPSDAQESRLVVVLPAGLQFIGATLPGGGSCTPTVGVTTVVNCLWSGATAPGTNRVVELTVSALAVVGAPIQATASALTGDPVSSNDLTTVQLVVLGLQVQIPLGGPLGAALLVLLLGAIGGGVLRWRGA